MKFVDRRGKIIKEGDYVRYDNTGTTGKIVEISQNPSLKGNDNKNSRNLEGSDLTWVHVDKTELWYLSNVLELISVEDANLSKFEQSQIENNNDNKKDDEKDEDDYKTDMVEELKQQMKDQDSTELASNAGEGGG
ncbi:DUF2098 family protein [Methanobrevibacter curvatus]|uniref:DUF2098 domain-containing protein n=1 Tax=Methanobrevibacter curvatus TaxID=49547 RepID=A0A166A9A6_9EURY|nr:DUF2098 family protein [Methanobrevibacter curvatus]KZX11738.1 hypothetical protein MBCUR_13250 [Methanobrevibacter curvatus]